MRQGYIDLTSVVYPIYLDIGDTLVINYSIVFGAIDDTVFGDYTTAYADKDGVWLSDIPEEKRLIVQALTVNWMTVGKYDVLSSTNMTIAVQGSVNGAEISDEKQNGYFINKFEFVDKISNNEMVEYLNNPQKSILLKNQSQGINGKLWTYNVSIDPNKNIADFILFNNITNL